MKLIYLPLLLVFFISCLGQSNEPSLISNDGKSSKAKHTSNLIRLKTVHGDILFKLFPNKAPVTVERISLLV